MQFTSIEDLSRQINRMSFFDYRDFMTKRVSLYKTFVPELYNNGVNRYQKMLEGVPITTNDFRLEGAVEGESFLEQMKSMYVI